MSKIKVAVVGGGHLGQIHTRLIKANREFQLVAVCDPQPLVQQRMIQEHDCRAVSDLKKVIHEIDAAIIASPTHNHFESARDCLQQGIHLLIEKPVTASLDQAEALLALAQTSAACVAVGHVERFNAAIAAAQEIVGTPKYIEAHRASGYTFRSTDVGAVLDLMVHDIDLVQVMFSGSLTHCQAIGVSVFGGHEDLAQARLQFSCGGVANLTASRSSFQPQRSFTIFGTQGFAQVDLAKHLVQAVRLPRWLAAREIDFLELSPTQQAQIKEKMFSEVLPVESVQIEPVNAIAAEQSDWAQAIRQQAQPRVTLEQGVANVRVAEMICQQIENHRWQPGIEQMTGARVDVPLGRLSKTPLPAGLQSETVRRAA